MSALSTLTMDVLLESHDLEEELRADARLGLLKTPKEMPPRWFYDERGSELFDEITRLPEYYLTRREREILLVRAEEIVVLSGADTLIELGSGTSEKTRYLLGAFARAGQLQRFVPFDVSRETLLEASRAAASDYAGIKVHAIVGDFERHLHAIPGGGRRLVAFLGSTIGNLVPLKRSVFFRSIADQLSPGDAFLLGADLVKDESRLVAAYDDAAGVTAQFNLNLLSVLNRALGCTFEPSNFEHVARFDRLNEWMDIRLRSRVAQVVECPTISARVEFAAGEEMRTEISAKFRRDGLEAELSAAGFEPTCWWTDSAGDFALAGVSALGLVSKRCVCALWWLLAGIGPSSTGPGLPRRRTLR